MASHKSLNKLNFSSTHTEPNGHCLASNNRFYQAMRRTRPATAGIILAALLTAACGSDSANDTQANHSETTNSKAWTSVDIPETPIDLSTAYTYVPEARPTGLTCAFATDDAVNAIRKRPMASAPFTVSFTDTDECRWSNEFAMSVSVKRKRLSDKKDPSTDRYNLDIEPEITTLSAPGSNAVVLSDEILQGPYALYFETDTYQLQIGLLGIATNQDRLVAFANEVATNATATIEVPSAPEPAPGPTLKPCEVLSGENIGALFSSDAPFSAEGSVELSLCEYKGSDANSNQISISITYSGNSLEPGDITAYNTPERLEGFSLPVFYNASGGTRSTYGIDHETGHIIIRVTRFGSQDDSDIRAILTNLVGRL
ncbi:MAG: hypothetical protein AAF296_02130 [Pseudomonadota bacterium]